MANPTTVPPTNLTPPGPDPNNVEKTKYFVFNQTGNIMMSTTALSDDSITDSVRAVFNEVSVFFAAMTKAITTTINPTTGLPYTIYNYNALSNIIGGSGLFVHVTEEDINFSTTSFGINFSKDLLEALLGLPSGAGELAFASAMIASIGNEGLTLSAKHTSSDSTVANITFVCEYLMGMPIVSAIVVYSSADTVTDVVNVGPCISVNYYSGQIAMHKDTYIFVTPTFIKAYSADLDSVMDDTDYNKFISYLQALLTGQPFYGDLTDSNGNPVSGNSLTAATTYVINGQNFGNTAGTLSFGPPATTNLLNVTNWTNNQITFTNMKTGSTLPTTAAALTITAANGKTVSSAGGYTMH